MITEILERGNDELPDAGMLVVALVDTSICKRGEVGVVYERYHSGISVIFKNGGYDGFDKDDLKRLILVLPVMSEELEEYDFTHVIKLTRDYEEGIFDEAFDVGDKFLTLAKQSYGEKV